MLFGRLVAVKVDGDEEVTALSWEASCPGRCESQRMNLVLVRRKLDLCVGHQIKHDDDASARVRYNRLCGVHDRKIAAANYVQEREVIFEELACRRHVVRRWRAKIHPGARVCLDCKIGLVALWSFAQTALQAHLVRLLHAFKFHR